MRRARTGFYTGLSLPEVMVALAGSTIILAALLMSCVQLQKALYASEQYAANQTAQRRMIDYLSRDLRRAIGIEVATTVNGSGGTRLAGGGMAIDGKTSLSVILPGYYQSESSGDAVYDEALPVVSMDNAVDYGTASGHASGVQVIFRKLFLANEGSECFVRLEGDTQTVIVREVENISVKVAVSADGRTCGIDVEFAPRGLAARVKTHDEVLLRNIRVD